MSVDDGAEAVELRRLLKDKTEQALQLAMELELQRRKATELWQQLDPLMNAAAEVIDVVGVMRTGPADEVLRETIPVIRQAQELYRERARHILFVAGCAGCGGDHRELWAQDLKPTVQAAFGKLQLDAQRAYVCPSTLRVVLVSNESEETVAHEG